MIQLAGRRRRSGTRSSVRLGAGAGIVALVVASCGSGEESVTTLNPDPNLVEKGTLTVCTSIPYAPFEFMENGKEVGFDIDLAKEVAKTLGLRTVIVNRRFEAVETGQLLNDGTCDVAAAALTITGERARVLDFSSPYFDAAQAMVVSEDSGITSLADLEAGKIGVEEGSIGELYVTDNASDDTEIVPFEFAAEVDAALDDGQIDAAVYDNTIVGDVISNYPDFEVAEVFPTDEQYGLAVKKNSNVELLRTINDVLASDEYDAIHKRWFGGSQADQ